ncbi:MAG TPA: ABC transporter permease [Candidatus Limnocylindria bacterium]|nr:ABC transporter permease [Candidatus Limnocylindria bacterium]
METREARRKLDLQRLFAPAALVILYIFFALVGRNFFSRDTAIQILESSYYIGLMAIGVTFVIITGGIDLSIGTVMMCSALIGGVAYTNWGFPFWLALCVVPLVGLAFGTLNGFMVAKWKLPPFIATLGTMMVSQGLGSIISGVRTMYYPTIGGRDEWFRTWFFRAGGFPIGAVYLIVAFAVGMFLLNRTRFGRYDFAIGSNQEAARLSGVDVDRWKILIYATCGLFAGLAGIFYGAAYTTIIPGKGNGEELNAIAAVVIGGTSMSGGSGTMSGTLIGVLIMSTLKRGLSSVGLQAHWQTFFTGFVVIGAVLLDNARNNAAIKAKTRAVAAKAAQRRQGQGPGGPA